MKLLQLSSIKTKSILNYRFVYYSRMVVGGKKNVATIGFAQQLA